jgi:predicted nuclease of predicted toxin-antitoxin system
MRILLDECLPARLRKELHGHDIQTVPGAGWDGVKNGRLLRLIAGSASYDVFVTMDKNLPSEQKTADLPFAIVVLRARSNRFEDTRPLERLKKFCSRLGRGRESGLFEFWRRFGSVAGRCGHAPSPKPSQNSKILAPNGYRISLTALMPEVLRRLTEFRAGHVYVLTLLE